MNGKLFPFRTKHKLYDSIILPGYWQCYLDWRRRGRSLARHRSGRPIATTLNYWRICRDLYHTLFHAISVIALLIAPVFAAAGYSLIYLLLGGGLGGAFLIFIVAKMVGK